MNLVHTTARAVTAGRFAPLGATLDATGCNFAIYSHHATEVYLQLFDRAGGPPTDTIRLARRTRFTFHAHVAGVRAGQLYGYRVRGPYDPARGHRFNEWKLLVDPYAKAVAGKLRHDDHLMLGYVYGSPERDLSYDARDNAAIAPRSVVVDGAFDWTGDAFPNIPFEQMVMYEVHLKGFTASPSSGVRAPGTYLGFIEKIPHLVELGVNAIELLPLHERGVAQFLAAKNLTNYWGYDTLGFFAPESLYRSGTTPGDEVREFKTLVRELHRAGIEVILDVVYNHTVEGSEIGPTVSLRGVDNATYYALTGSPEYPLRAYQDWAGCGNSLDLTNRHTIRFVMDSLRYWREEMHIDGFRFDLASVLGRGSTGAFHKLASFFDVIAQDPTLANAKLIAEPWDLSTYQVGNFPVDWSEWNGRFRDTVRRFEKGDAGQISDLAYRLSGSSDLYGDDGRHPYNTVNFVTCHDGFTLWDLVSHDHKHNEANLEDSRDGANDNASWNSGVEGPTDDPAIVNLRKRRARNLIVELLFSAGTPMLLGGDEMLRTQRGNNNAYCQDNELSWFDWTLVDKNRDFLAFVRQCIAFRKAYPVLQRRTFFSGNDSNHDTHLDLCWFGPDLAAPAWGDPDLRTLGYLLDGQEAHVPGDYLIFVVLNASWNPHAVAVPHPGAHRRWTRVIDTAAAAPDDFIAGGVPHDGATYQAAPRSSAVLLARPV